MTIEFKPEVTMMGTITMPIDQIIALEALMYKLYEKGSDEDSDLKLETDDWLIVHQVTKLIGDSDVHRHVNNIII